MTIRHAPLAALLCCAVAFACGDDEHGNAGGADSGVPSEDAAADARAPEQGPHDASADTGGDDVVPAQPKARRGRMDHVDTPPLHEVPQACELLEACDDGRALVGKIDKNSIVWESPNIVFFLDAYVITAKRSGSLSVASSVQAIGDAYEYGYGYPLSAQAVASTEGLPTLSSKLPLVVSTDSYETALDDGKASISFHVDAGQQYLVIFKQLVGPSRDTNRAWNYTLSFCGADLSMVGRLWVTSDQQDTVPVEPLVEPLSEASAPGTMGRLVEELEVSP
ncbi:MAG: hypothetical protein QM778_16105 [Myxococcales bacterium]